MSILISQTKLKKRAEKMKKERLYDITISPEALLKLKKAKRIFRTKDYSNTIIVLSELGIGVFDNFQKLEDFLKFEKYKEALSLLFALFYKAKEEVRK